MDINSFKKALKKAKGNNLVVFLFFLLVSCSLWFSLTLNRIYETDISVSVRVENVPDGVLLEDGGEVPVRMVVRGEGTALFGYFFNDGMSMGVDYATFVRNGGNLAMPVNALRSMVVEALGPSLTLKSFLNDSVVVSLQRATAVVPVRKNRFDLRAAEGYEIVSVEYEPEEVRITAFVDELSAVRDVRTPVLVCNGLEADTVFEMPFLPGRFIDVRPASVQVSVSVSRYVERMVNVPVEYVKFPSDINLGFLPQDVDVVYEVLEINEEKVKPTDFAVRLHFDDYAHSVMLGEVGDLEGKFSVSADSDFVRNARVVGVEVADSSVLNNSNAL